MLSNTSNALALHDKKLHVFPRWFRCRRNYEGTATGKYLNYSFSYKTEDFTTWREPWEKEYGIESGRNTFLEINLPYFYSIDRNPKMSKDEFREKVSEYSDLYKIKFTCADNNAWGIKVSGSESVAATGDKRKIVTTASLSSLLTRHGISERSHANMWVIDNVDGVNVDEDGYASLIYAVEFTAKNSFDDIFYVKEESESKDGPMDPDLGYGSWAYNPLFNKRITPKGYPESMKGDEIEYNDSIVCSAICGWSNKRVVKLFDGKAIPKNVYSGSYFASYKLLVQDIDVSLPVPPIPGVMSVVSILGATANSFGNLSSDYPTEVFSTMNPVSFQKEEG